MNTINLDTLLVEETHRWELVDLDRLSDDTLGNVGIIRGPLESGPVESWWLVAVLNGLFEGESSKRPSGLDVPDNVLVSLVFGTERLSQGKGFVGPSDEVVLARRELDESDTRVGESKDVDTDGTIQSRS